MKKYFFTLSVIILTTYSISAHAWQSQYKKELKNGGAIVQDKNGKILFSHNAKKHFIPASTIKVATSACALDVFGLDYRFKTDFFLTKDKILAVKGYGDPFLVSEELKKIAFALKQKGLKKINGMILDNTYFDKNIVVDGASRSSNPYDALNGALIANFNTVYFRKSSSTNIQSAESQTPLTPLAVLTAKKYGNGKHRVNLGRNTNIGARYFGELIQIFLKQAGVTVSGDLKIQSIPNKAKLLYQHKSSKTVSDIVKGLLEFSTNFMSNQLYLAMGAKAFGAPATVEKGRKVLKQFLSQKVGWKNYEVVEGAGLSRQNKVTAMHMLELLEYFEKYKYLLPLKDGVFRAKTGTLTGVNTYAGYFPLSKNNTAKFVILVNSAVPYNYKFLMAKKLYKYLTQK